MLQAGGDPQTFGGVSWIVPKGVEATADLAGPERERTLLIDLNVGSDFLNHRGDAVLQKW